MSDLISIITPLYNSRKYILETIQSVQSQTYDNWEMIVIDDCSSDGSAEVVKIMAKDDLRIKLTILEKNSGPAGARNTGIKLASGRYLAFLDSDDLWHEQKLNKQLRFMQKNNYAFTYTGYEKINEAGEVIGTIFPYKEEVCYYDLLKSNHIGCLTAMFDSKLLGYKMYMPNIKKRQDQGFWLSILKKTNRAYCLNEILAKYRIRSGSISKNKTTNIKYQWKLYRDIEQLNLMQSIYYMFIYAFYGIRKYNN